MENLISVEDILPFLETTVPLHSMIAASWSADRLRSEAEIIADAIIAGGDTLFHPDWTWSKADMKLPTPADQTAEQAKAGVMCRPYRPAEILNACAKAVAYNSLGRGGIFAFGRVWCAKHPRETVPGPAGVCAACEREELAT